ncbi:MAG: hypothetical protein LLG04_03795, partial [Parachlamydia sp.]|nr:hypothetical protein [Parachlamydia sp.]
MIKIFTSHILPPATAALEAGIVDYALAGTFARGGAIVIVAGTVYHVALVVINKNYDIEAHIKHCIA